MEIILLLIYSAIVWFIFFKKKWLPWNITSQVIVVTIPIFALTVLILFMNIVAPSSHDVRAMNYVIPIVPRVSGQVTEVPIEPNRPIKKGDVRLTLSSGAELLVSDVLVAAGRSSNTETLDLAAAGLTPGKRGLLTVDARCRTEVPPIYAAGDVIGPPALAATGMEQARVAMCAAFDLMKKETSPLLPTGIYTIPEASMVGETEQTLKTKGIACVVGRAPYAQNPRGRIIGDEHGFLKLLFRREDMRLLGVHVVGEQATELVHVGLLAMHCEAGAELFSRVCFNCPTLGDLYKYAAYDAMLQCAPR